MRFRSLIQGGTPWSAYAFEPGPQAEIVFVFFNAMGCGAARGTRCKTA